MGKRLLGSVLSPRPLSLLHFLSSPPTADPSIWAALLRKLEGWPLSRNNQRGLGEKGAGKGLPDRHSAPLSHMAGAEPWALTVGQPQHAPALRLWGGRVGPGQMGKSETMARDGGRMRDGQESPNPQSPYQATGRTTGSKEVPNSAFSNKHQWLKPKEMLSRQTPLSTETKSIALQPAN